MLQELPATKKGLQQNSPEELPVAFEWSSGKVISNFS